MAQREPSPRLQRLRWMREGTALFLDALTSVSDADLTTPTALDGWTGAHLLAHVSTNAEALGNLVRWARTGQECQMYSAPAQRNQDIEDGSHRPITELRDWVMDSAAALDDALSDLSDNQWRNRVKTAQGRDVDATEIPWMRVREVVVHAIDLGPCKFADFRADLLATLIDDIVLKRSTSPGPALSVRSTDTAQQWEIPGEGKTSTVHSSFAV